MSDHAEPASETSSTVESHPRGWSEDVVAIVAGGIILLGALLLTWTGRTVEDNGATSFDTYQGWVAKPGKWDANPMDSVRGGSTKLPHWFSVVRPFFAFALLFSVCLPLMKSKHSAREYAIGLLILYCLAMLSYVLAGQAVIKAYNLEYALWALFLGVVVGNTIGTDAFGTFGKAAFRSELYIKTGLVILGGGVLFSKLLALGPPGVMIAWVVTPIVLITTFWFGQKILKIESASLNMTISADMSVCGVSAAIATGAACNAKKEELSAAIGLSLTFTAVMMVVLPAAIKALGLDEIIGGAWIGGTIDATGAVAVSGALLGENAEKVAMTIKMIQNILIGVVAVGVAAYWSTRSDQQPADGEEASTVKRTGLSEIWKRFPKFVLGFFAASVLFSLIYSTSDTGQELVGATVSNTKVLRGWLFCLAFVCIGMELNFRKLSQQFVGGKPFILYLCGQSLNLILTLLMALFAFKVAFPNAEENLLK